MPLSDEEDGSMLFDNVTKSALDPFDTSSGSVQLIAIKPVALPPAHPGTDRTQDTAILNGEVRIHLILYFLLYVEVWQIC